MVRGIRILLASGLVACAVAGSVFAETFTLCLDEPTLGGPEKAPVAQSTKKPAKKPEAPKQKTVTVGKVGTVKVNSAPIYHKRSYTSRKYITVGSDTPLAIVKEIDGWYGVMMANGEVGWLPVKHVSLTGYELIAKREPRPKTSGSLDPNSIPKTGSWTDDLIRTATTQYTGVSYVYGGTDPNSGMDCSAFVRMIFSQYSIPLPRTAREQAQVGQTIPLDQLQPGDRLYFQCKNSYIDHCGIYAGDGKFVHCSSSKGGVAMDSLSKDFYWRSLVVAKRS